jgi:hypothetical protein
VLPPSANPGRPSPGPGIPGIPPTKPPSLPPTKPPSLPPTRPTDPTPPSRPTEPAPPTTPTDPPPPTDPTKPTDPVDDGPGITPWLLGGAGLVAAGAGGYLAWRTAARNLHALDATAAAYAGGAMHQGGLHAISDAGLGARFADGIGLGERALVSIPGVNRFGTGGRLSSVARGHLDHAELMASATALRRTGEDSVAVHEPLRRHVLEQLESGRPIGAVLDDLDRSAGGARPVFSGPRLRGYWDEASIVERAPRARGEQVASAATDQVPHLELRDGVITPSGGDARIDRIVARRDARLGSTGLADGVGSIQAANVATLPPALQERAIAMSRVDPALVDSIGLRGAYVQRWHDRLAPA